MCKCVAYEFDSGLSFLRFSSSMVSHNVWLFSEACEILERLSASLVTAIFFIFACCIEGRSRIDLFLRIIKMADINLI